MPIISMFYGIIVMMYYFDDRRHHQPHIQIHQGDLMADWRLATSGQAVFKIQPLK
jgi:hypothetical protein